MKDASYEDAIAVGKQLNLNKDEVWKIVQGLKFSTLSELCMAVHAAFKPDGLCAPGGRAHKEPAG